MFVLFSNFFTIINRFLFKILSTISQIFHLFFRKLMMKFTNVNQFIFKTISTFIIFVFIIFNFFTYVFSLYSTIFIKKMIVINTQKNIIYDC